MAFNLDIAFSLYDGGDWKDLKAQKKTVAAGSSSPAGFSQMRPSVVAVHGLALSPATCARSRKAQKPESLGSPGSQRRLLLVKGDMSSQPQ